MIATNGASGPPQPLGPVLRVEDCAAAGEIEVGEDRA
jgi:hypothetical protein